MALFARPPRPRFDRLGPEHSAAAAKLHAAAFAHGWSEIDFERLLAAGTSVSDAAFDARSGEPVGLILSRAAAEEAEVLTIVVAASRRGKGLGGDLLRRHLAQLADLNVQALYLEVNADNVPARALYARHRFAEVGRRSAYYPDVAGQTRTDALVLRRSIP